MILDTTFVIDVMAGEEVAAEKAHEIQESHRAYMIAAPVIYEIWIGITRTHSPESKKKRLMQLVGSQPIYSLDAYAAEEAGKIQGELYNKGEPVEPLDAMIAGIARVQDQPILTRNADHFNRIENVHVETY